MCENTKLKVVNRYKIKKQESKEIHNDNNKNLLNIKIQLKANVPEINVILKHITRKDIDSDLLCFLLILIDGGRPIYFYLFSSISFSPSGGL